MTLTQNQKKVLHSVENAFIMGALAASQEVVRSGFTSKAALVGAVSGIIGGGLSRVAGWQLARMETAQAAAAPK